MIKNILVIDCNKTTGEIIKAALGEEHIVYQAQNTFEARKLIEQQKPHTIFVGSSEKESTLQIVSIIRSFDETREAKIVAMTGDDSEETVNAYRALGVEQILIQPFSVKKFKETI